MAEQTVIHNTFVIERSYPACPERVFAAFAEPAKKRRWFVESEYHDVEQFEMDFRREGLSRRVIASRPVPRSPGRSWRAIATTRTSSPTSAL